MMERRNAGGDNHAVVLAAVGLKVVPAKSEYLGVFRVRFHPTTAGMILVDWSVGLCDIYVSCRREHRQTNEPSHQ